MSYCVDHLRFLFSLYKVQLKMAGQYPKRVLSTKRRVDHGAGVSKSGHPSTVGMPLFPRISRARLQ